MMSILSLFLVLFCLVCSSCASSSHNSEAVLPPSADPFYAPPPGYEDTPPGTILRYRTTPHPIAAVEPIPVSLAAEYQLLYRSNDHWGNPIAIVTTVLIPKNAHPAKVLSYQIPDDSASPNCAPSYTLQIDTPDSDLVSKIGIQGHTVLFQAALEKGWIVSLPDFQGPDAAFLVSRLAGHAVLDGIRALFNATDLTGISPRASVAMWGYSGGSLATGFAAELQSSYAPELDMIVGAVIGGVVADLETVMRTVNHGSFAGLNFAGLLGLAHGYPHVATLLQEQLVDDAAKRARFDKAKHNCFLANLAEYAFDDALSYFKDRNLFGSPALQRAFHENNLGSRVPSMPILAYHGHLDETSPPTGTEALIAKYCESGATVDYRDVVTHDHVLLPLDGFLDSIAWLEKRMDGEPMQSACQRVDELLPLSEPGSLDTLVLTVEGEAHNILDN